MPIIQNSSIALWSVQITMIERKTLLKAAQCPWPSRELDPQNRISPGWTSQLAGSAGAAAKTSWRQIATQQPARPTFATQHSPLFLGSIAHQWIEDTYVQRLRSITVRARSRLTFLNIFNASGSSQWVKFIEEEDLGHVVRNQTKICIHIRCLLRSWAIGQLPIPGIYFFVGFPIKRVKFRGRSARSTLTDMYRYWDIVRYWFENQVDKLVEIKAHWLKYNIFKTRPKLILKCFACYQWFKARTSWSAPNIIIS